MPEPLLHIILGCMIGAALSLSIKANIEVLKMWKELNKLSRANLDAINRDAQLLHLIEMDKKCQK